MLFICWKTIRKSSLFSRIQCEKFASQVEECLITPQEAAAVEHIFDFHLVRHKQMLESVSQYHTLRSLLLRGIAFHHSGVLPLLKEIVEILLIKGFVRALFCTDSAGIGLNLPERTVVFLSYEKYDEQIDGLRYLTTAEATQLAGRAGRRGRDRLQPIRPTKSKKYPEGKLR